MRRATLAVLLFFLLPVLAAAQDARQEILAADARRFAAMIQGDQAALDALLADDLTYTHSSGQLETRPSSWRACAPASSAICPSSRRTRRCASTATPPWSSDGPR